MKSPQIRVFAAFSLVLIALLSVAAVQNWRALRDYDNSRRTVSTLDQSVADCDTVRASVKAATAAAISNLQHSDPTASATYDLQKLRLQDATGRLRNELQTVPALADRAANLQLQTQSLLVTLDPLAMQSATPITLLPTEESLNTVIRNPSEALLQDATALRAGAKSQLDRASAVTMASTGRQLQLMFVGILAILVLAVGAAIPIVLLSLKRARREEEFQRAAELNGASFHAYPQMVLTCNLNGTVTSMNPAAESMLDNSSNAALARGNHLHDFLVAGEFVRIVREALESTPWALQGPLVADSEAVAAFAQFLQNMPPGRLSQCPMQFRRTDGSIFTGLASLAPLRSTRGNVIGFCLIAGDDTERLRTDISAHEKDVRLHDLFAHTSELVRRESHLQAELLTSRQNEQVLNAVAEGIFLLDAEGATLLANPAAANLLSITPSELVMNDLHRLLHGNRPGGLQACGGQCNLLRALHGEEATAGQDTLFRREGPSVPIEFSAAPMMENGQHTGTVCVLRDISQRYAMDRLKDEFVSTVSHELRTPLTSIRGALGLLSTGLLGDVPEKAQNLLRIAVSNTDRLVRLINDVLDLERMESGRAELHLRQLDLGDLIQQAVETMRPMAEAAGIQIVFTAERCACEADADRIMQVLTNLLSNAIKFSDPGSHIVISVSNGDEILSIAVADQGRGVPDDKLESVFDRFQQVNSTDSSQKGGTGLGLAICRSILQQHGGRIWAERNTPRGSIFRMVIPRSQNHSVQSVFNRESLMPLPLLEQQSILVCDDDAIARSMVRHHLRRHGYQVIEAESGEQALELAHQHKLDAILLDLFMPGINGWETLQRLKADIATADIPVIILSVFSSRPINNASDIRGWVSKPFTELSLLSALGNALSSVAAGPAILLVEDDNAQAEIITAYLQKSGLTVHRAGSLPHAVRVCHQLRPELMVLDMALPNDEGMQIVRWLRQHHELASMPLVVYSAMEPSIRDLELLTQGPTQILTQTIVQPAELELLVMNMLRRQKTIPGKYFPEAPVFGNTVEGSEFDRMRAH